MFDEKLIKRAGDGKHSITFQVIDRCGNRPHAFAPWAIPTEVSVNVNRIPAPTVTGEQGDVLDPAYLSSIQVVASGAGLLADDSVRVHWQGRIERETTPKTYSGNGALEFFYTVGLGQRKRPKRGQCHLARGSWKCIARVRG